MGKNRKRFRRVNIESQLPKPRNVIDIPIQYHNTTIECKKNIYNKYISASARNVSSVEAYRKKYDIIVGGNVSAPDPIESFDVIKETPFNLSLLKAYGRPSPMLSETLPIVLSGCDMIGLTRSGPERTLAYILPAILHIHQQPKSKPNEGPIVLVLTLSLELGENILQIASLFDTGIRMALFSGGSSPTFVSKNLESGIEMVIACADTANTLLSLNKMSLKRCSMVIFDDVDAQISRNAQILTKVLKYAPTGRQLLCFSQMWWEALNKIPSEHMQNGYCTVEVGKFHRDVHRICQQQLHILEKPKNRMEYTLHLIRKIQSSSSGKILVFVMSKEDSINLAKYLRTVGMLLTAASLNENGASVEEGQQRIESFRNGSTNCLITVDCVRTWLCDDIEHVIHFNFHKEYYGMRLSHMSYTRTGGTSHIILYKTEYNVAKSVIEKLQYGNQEICTELLAIKSKGPKEHVQAKEDNIEIPTIEISDEESDTNTSKIIAKGPQTKFDVNDAGAKKIQNNASQNSYSKRIANNNAKDSHSRKESNSIKPNSRVTVAGIAIKRTQPSREILPLFPEAKKQKLEPSTTDKWSGADVILQRILIEEESIKKALSINATEQPTLPVHRTNGISNDFALSSENVHTNYTPTTAHNTSFLSTNLQSMSLPFLPSSIPHLDGNANSQLSRNKDVYISPWSRREDTTVNQSQFMSNSFDERFLAGNNMNSNSGQMIYQRRSNQ